MFQTKSKRRKVESKSKTVKYLRDIFCLPHYTKTKNGVISIPRGSRRSFLASKEIGLMGKIEFSSYWPPERMRREVCRLFAKPFGTTEVEIESGKLFGFEYLQRTGAGSRTLCVPSVSSNYEWSGRQVATLSKSGGVIYILANEDIPILTEIVSIIILIDIAIYIYIEYYKNVHVHEDNSDSDCSNQSLAQTGVSNASVPTVLEMYV